MKKNFLSVALSVIAVAFLNGATVLYACDDIAGGVCISADAGQENPVVNNRDKDRIQLKLSLEEVIEMAKDHSLEALMAKHSYIVSYWQFRTYKAQFLPSLNMQASLGNYNRSIVDIQDAITGEIHYVSNNNLRNSLGFSIDQAIPFTGGTVSLTTSLDRLDQFSPGRSASYNSQPVYLNYNQPLFAFNQLKWDKKIEPVKYRQAQVEYLEDLESAAATGIQYFFDLLLAQKDLEVLEKSIETNENLYRIAQERFKLGTVEEDELLQLQQNILTNNLDLSDKKILLEQSKIRFRTFLGLNDNVDIELVLEDFLPEIRLDYTDVIARSEKNSSFMIGKELDLINAESAVARAKSQRGMEVSFNATFGLTQVGDNLKMAYTSPLDQEIVGLSLRMPILDWGLGKGRVQVAKSQQKVTEMQVDQAIAKQREDILQKVMQLNSQGEKCRLSSEAEKVGRQRYESTKNRFMNGSVDVMKLNDAQESMDSAVKRYLEDLKTFWSGYYEIRKLTLYDYVEETEISADFEAITSEL